MTEQDIKNRDILISVFKNNLSLSESSKAFAEDWLMTAHDKIDPMLRKVMGDDLRARWAIPAVSSKDDEGWKFFKKFFEHAVSALSITYDMYQDNLYVDGKSKVKLTKTLRGYYEKNLAYLYSKAVLWDALGIYPKYDGLKAANSKDGVELYITKANEYIGRYKKPKEEYELVVTSNFADWIMASTGESWSSCISLDSGHGYWIGLPFMLDDRNRMMIYITKKNGPKKEYAGIKVDQFMFRTWAFISNEDRILYYRWYPGSEGAPFNITQIAQFTKLPFYEGSLNKSKYPFGENIKFEKGGGYTPYLDTIKMYLDGKSAYYSTGRGNSGVNRLYSQNGNTVSINGYAKLKLLIKSGISYEDYGNIVVCSHCGSKANRNTTSYHNVNGELYCPTCTNELFFTCQRCDGRHPKDKKIITKEFKKGICNNCYEREYQKCSCCGDYSVRSNTVEGICKKCLADETKVGKCAYSGKLIVKKSSPFILDVLTQKIYFENNEYIGQFFEDMSKEEKAEYATCSECSVKHHKSLLILDLDGLEYCGKCLTKLSSKNQMWFDFGKAEKKKKKSDEAMAAPVAEAAIA